MRELKQQLVSALLVILTVAAVVAAAINFQQQSRYHLPDDGVTWVDLARTMRADTKIAGLVAGIRYWFRCRTLTKEGVGDGNAPPPVEIVK